MEKEAKFEAERSSPHPPGTTNLSGSSSAVRTPDIGASIGHATSLLRSFLLPLLFFVIQLTTTANGPAFFLSLSPCLQSLSTRTICEPFGIHRHMQLKRERERRAPLWRYRQLGRPAVYRHIATTEDTRDSTPVEFKKTVDGGGTMRGESASREPSQGTPRDHPTRPASTRICCVARGKQQKKQKPKLVLLSLPPLLGVAQPTQTV